MALLSSVLAMALGLWHVDVCMFINILIVFEQILWVYLKKTIGACFCILGICSVGFLSWKTYETKEASHRLSYFH